MSNMDNKHKFYAIRGLFSTVEVALARGVLESPKLASLELLHNLIETHLKKECLSADVLSVPADITVTNTPGVELPAKFNLVE